MTTLSAYITGPKAANLPYDEKSAEYEKLEKVLKAEIIRLVRAGVSNFYTGGRAGVDTLAALLVLRIKEELGTTAQLHLALPYMDCAGFGCAQKDDFDRILRSADTVSYFSERYAPGSRFERNRHMIEMSDYLIAVAQSGKRRRETDIILGMARKKGMEIAIIDPLTFEITREERKQGRPNG